MTEFTWLITVYIINIFNKENRFKCIFIILYKRNNYYFNLHLLFISSNVGNKLKIINSIVNTLTNLKEIDSVKFLINGEENEKLPDIYVRNS